MIEWLVIGGILALIFIFIAVLLYYYNKIVIMGNRIDNALSQIDVQLKKRADLVPNLVETVKGYAKHEKKVFTDVTKARERMLQAGNMRDKVDANNQLSAALRSVFAIAENYPKLQASENFKLLQEQLEGIENKIAYSRQYYNDSILSYNNSVTTIPGKWFAGMLNRKPREFLRIEEAEKKPVKVTFD
jgi:LemA protein